MINKSKYIDNIDTCTALLFNQIMTGEKDITSLCIKGRANLSKCTKAWTNIYNEYIKEFGLPNEYIEYLKGMIKANEYRIDAYIKGQTFKEPLATIEEVNAKNLVSGTPQKLSVIAGRVSKAMGIHIDLNNISVRQFYGYIKSLENE